ncbi:MAG: UvrD-helicase domain-containing protein, partial [Acidobacteriota bacterium]|nr:UvrD-helicase domain-containing protein [Acidobacteriota bacterium]
MSGAPRDHDARERAMRDHDAHLAVEAGAGTGKTTLLVGRIVEGLRREKLTMRRLGAITFTRKAAGELRTRLRAEIARARERDDSPELERARREQPLARVSTIHAFCHRILRQNPLAAGLDPDFEVVDETRQDELFDELWRQWLSGAPRGAGAGVVAEAIAAGASTSTVAEAARQLVENPDVEPPEEEPGPDAETVWRRVRERAGEIAREVARIRKEGAEDKLADGVAAFVAALDRVEALDPPSRVRWLARRVVRDAARRSYKFEIREVRSKGRIPAYTDRDALERVRVRLDDWRQRDLPELLREHHADVAARAARGLAHFRDWARNARRERGTLSQNDLLEEARRLLAKKSTGALTRLARELDALMIDEYQDTDPIQAAIVRLLRERDGGPRVFVVGDPKQSIYRFRRADVLTYMEDVSEADRREALERIFVNFRSRAGVLRAVNTVGREVMDAAAGGGTQAAWQDLEASETTPAGRGGPSFVLVPAGAGEQKLLSEELAAREAGALAHALRRAREDGYSWREMAVLFAASSHLATLEDVLDAAGVPYRQEKSRDFFRRVEIAELGHLATAVADPWDETAVVGLLRSRLFGIDDAALLAHASAGGRFVAARDPAEAGEPEVREALAAIAGWHERSRRETPPELLGSILRETGFLVLLAGLPHGERDLANVRKLLDTAEVRWSEGDAGVADFARWLRRQLAADGVREAESPSAEEEDRVSLLTIHAAKGMQWHVVGLYDVHAGRSGQRPAVVIGRGSGGEGAARLAVAFSPVMRTRSFDALADRDLELDDAERARLLYVALTRARERIVLPFPASDKPSPKRGSLHELLRRSATWRAWEDAARAGRDPDAPHVATVADEAVVSARRARRKTASEEDAAASAAAREAWCLGRREACERADRLVVTIPSDLHAEIAAERGPGGAGPASAAGSAVHRALEWLATGAVQDASRAAERASVLHALCDEAGARVREM